MRDEWVKYTICSELDMGEDSAYGVRSGCLRQEGHLPQLLGSACPRVHLSVDGWTGLDRLCANVQLLCPNRQHRTQLKATCFFHTTDHENIFKEINTDLHLHLSGSGVSHCTDVLSYLCFPTADGLHNHLELCL